MASIRFSGGDKLKAKLAEIAKNLQSKSTLEVGWPSGATYPENQGGTPVAAVAAIQEFGAPAKGIPPRPFFRPVIAKKSGEWGEELAGYLAKTDYNSAQSLATLGEADIKPDLQESIVSVNSPALSPVTLMLRKMKSENQGLVVTGKAVGEAAARVAAGESTDGVSTKPLIETSVMLNGIKVMVS